MTEPLQYVARDADTKEQLILSLSDYQILIIRSVHSFEEPYAKRNKAQNSIFVPTPP